MTMFVRKNIWLLILAALLVCPQLSACKKKQAEDQEETVEKAKHKPKRKKGKKKRAVKF